MVRLLLWEGKVDIISGEGCFFVSILVVHEIYMIIRKSCLLFNRQLFARRWTHICT